MSKNRMVISFHKTVQRVWKSSPPFRSLSNLIIPYIIFLLPWLFCLYFNMIRRPSGQQKTETKDEIDPTELNSTLSQVLFLGSKSLNDCPSNGTLWGLSRCAQVVGDFRIIKYIVCLGLKHFIYLASFNLYYSRVMEEGETRLNVYSVPRMCQTL